MAYGDFLHCDYCDYCDTKSIYDANIDYDNVNVGDLSVICRDCYNKVELVMINKETGKQVERKYSMFGLGFLREV